MEGRASQPGFDVKETSQFLLTHSDDDGLTWSEPVNLQRYARKRSGGYGRQRRVMELPWMMGRWFPFPGPGQNGEPFSNITYSQTRERPGKRATLHIPIRRKIWRSVKRWLDHAKHAV